MIVPQPLTIRVPITGYPTPVAKWTFGEKELSADERVSVVTKPTFAELTITPSMRPDKGTYTLQLENDVSSVSGEIEVNVIGMKKIYFFELQYNTRNNPPSCFQPQQTYMAKQTSTAADGTFLFPACPSAPKDFKVAEVSRHHVHLMWEAPEHDGGSPVTHYQIEKREVSRKTWVKVHVKFCSPSSSGPRCDLWSVCFSTFCYGQFDLLLAMSSKLFSLAPRTKRTPRESSRNSKVHITLERLDQI